MIDVKEATKAAMVYLAEILGTSDVSLEEVEKDDSGRFWLITLGFHNSRDIYAFGRKSYKVFKVDIETGKVLSMKIREIK